jgi:O-acetyl-ADP-ribose deacetylase (regulator of RNase III)
MPRLEAVQADITTLSVDAIVNAANSTLLGGGGVDGAIHRAAGPQLREECKTLNGCKTGEAKITKGHNLPAKHVIHTVGPVYSRDPQPEVLLANAYRNSLRIAAEHQLSSIAFPSISTGVYGYPIEEAARIAVATIRQHMTANAYPERVMLVAFGDEDYAVIKAAIANL